MSHSDFTALLLFIKHYHELLRREDPSTVVIALISQFIRTTQLHVRGGLGQAPFPLQENWKESSRKYESCLH